MTLEQAITNYERLLYNPSGSRRRVKMRYWHKVMLQCDKEEKFRWSIRLRRKQTLKEIQLRA